MTHLGDHNRFHKPPTRPAKVLAPINSHRQRCVRLSNLKLRRAVRGGRTCVLYNNSCRLTGASENRDPWKRKGRYIPGRTTRDKNSKKSNKWMQTRTQRAWSNHNIHTLPLFYTHTQKRDRDVYESGKWQAGIVRCNFRSQASSRTRCPWPVMGKDLFWV